MGSIVTGLLSGGVGNLLDGVSKVINSIKGKNPEDAAKLEQIAANYQNEFSLAQLQIERDRLTQATQLALAQSETNKAEASSLDRFRAGWRPLVGYVCAVGLGIQFIVRPFAIFFAALSHRPTDFPVLDMGTLMTLLIGMLGLGAYRTQEKLKGVD